MENIIRRKQPIYARKTMERHLGRSVVSPERASDYIKAIENKEEDNNPEI
jgi:hypothetical protein